MEMIPKYVELFWRVLKHENRIRRIALFGSGKHTIWLSGLLQNTDGPKVVAVLDDTPSNITIFGMKPMKAETFDARKADAIILSSDCMQDKMRKRCRQLYGNDIKLIDIYEGLPPGPYPKDTLPVVTVPDIQGMTGLNRTGSQFTSKASRRDTTNKDGRPMVSAIVPVYNKQKELPLRLDTVFGQTYKNVEVAILDNASEDGSREIIYDYVERHKRTRKISTKFNETNNHNVFRQWANGLSMTSGNYIWIAEADDFSHVDFLTRAMAVFKKHPSVGLVYCQSHFVDENDLIFGNHINDLVRIDPTLWFGDFVCSGHEVLSKHMAISNVIPNASGVVFRRKLAEKIEWENIYQYNVCGDWRVWSEMLNNTDIAFISESLNFFRFNSKTTRTATHHTAKYLHETLDTHHYLFQTVNPDAETRKKAFAYFNEKMERVNKHNGTELRMNIPEILEKQYRIWGVRSIALHN